MYGLTLITAPVGEPLTLAEVQQHLRVVEPEDDALLERLITAARQHFEERDSRRLLTQTWKLTLDRFPYCGGCAGYSHYQAIEIPLRPVQSISFIKYRDSDGVLQTMDPADYQVDLSSFVARVSPAYGLYWPSTRYQMNAVEIQFVCGYGDPETVEDPAFDGTNYQLMAETNWMTPIGITAKSATGFTIEFGNAAPADGSGRVKYQAVAGSPRQVLIDSEAEIDADALTQDVEFETTIPTPSTIVGGVPEPLKAALLLHIGHMFENREDTIAGVSLQSIPRGYEALVGSNRRIHV